MIEYQHEGIESDNTIINVLVDGEHVGCLWFYEAQGVWVYEDDNDQTDNGGEWLCTSLYQSQVELENNILK